MGIVPVRRRLAFAVAGDGNLVIRYNYPAGIDAFVIGYPGPPQIVGKIIAIRWGKLKTTRNKKERTENS